MSDLNDFTGLPHTDPPPEILEVETDQAQDLHDELEDLAKVFQEELDRAKEEARAVAESEPTVPEIELPETVSIPPALKKSPAADEPIPEEELCECCGEKRRGTANDPDSPYCSECDTGLRHYPFDFLNVFFAVVAICFVFYGGYVFADHTSTFVAVQKADSLQADQQMYSALDAYAAAANTMLNNHINGELVYKREILLAHKLGYISSLSEPAANVRTWELSLPHFRSLKYALDDSAAFLTTWEHLDTLTQSYLYTDPSEIPYEELVAKMDAMKSAQVATEPTTEAQAEGETTAANAYTPEVKTYSVAAIGFYKYRLAAICEKDLETQIAILEEIQKEAPEYVWLYAPLLGEMYAKTGRDVEPMCRLIESENLEDDAPSLFRVISLRVQGKYDEAFSLCEERIANADDLTDEFYRQESLIYLAQGKYNDAYTTIDTAYQNSSPSVQLCETLALAAAAAGQESAYNEVKELLEENGYTLSAEVTGYKDGTVTLNQILLEGDFDIT